MSHLSVNQAGIYFPTENIGASTVDGAELEVQFLATPTTLLTAQLQYLDTAYDDFTYQQVNLTSAADMELRYGCPATPIAPLPITPTAALYQLDCSGFQMPLAPEWTANVGIGQRFALDAGNELVFSVSGRYRSSQYTQIDFAYRDSAHTTADAALMYQPTDGRWSAGIWINNITDEKVPTIVGFNPSVPLQTTSLRPPRTFGARLTFKY